MSVNGAALLHTVVVPLVPTLGRFWKVTVTVASSTQLPDPDETV
jgi:hypothetical protein